jgi:hypothetical protein
MSLDGHVYAEIADYEGHRAKEPAKGIGFEKRFYVL